MKASAKNCLLAGFLNGLNGGAGGSRVSGASIFSAIPACIVVGFSKRKPLEPLWLKGFFVGTNVLIGVISKSLFYNGLRMVTSSIYLLSITLNYEK